MAGRRGRPASRRPCFPGFDALGALRQVTTSGFGYSWFVLDAQTLAEEFALSGSEQNGDLTGKDLRLLAGPGPAGTHAGGAGILERGVDFVSAGSVPSWRRR